jgi:hypothetical protein
MPEITLTNAHGTFTCKSYELDARISRHMPASVNDLQAKMEALNPAFDYSDVHYVSEFLIMLADNKAF